MSTYLIGWKPDNTPNRHMFQLLEAPNAEEAVRKFESIYGKTAAVIAFPLSGNGWGYLREVSPPNNKRINANNIMF